MALDAKVLAEMTACYAEGEMASADSYDRLAAMVGRMKAAALGPGIPTGEGMTELVKRLVAELPVPLLVDAHKKKTYSISKDGQLSALALHPASTGTGRG